MNKPSVNLQDLFLNQVRKENIAVTVYLINSVQLRGHVRGFDTFTLALESPGRPTQLVYKSAITSIVPMRPVHMREAAEAARAAAGESLDMGDHSSEEAGG
jgi:host factor-I protein